MRQHEHPRTWHEFLEQLSPGDAQAFAMFIRSRGFDERTTEPHDLEQLYAECLETAFFDRVR